MHTLERWRPFLLGRHFKVYTDHRSLVHFKTQSNLNQRQLRWQEKAADYDMEILYKPGKENVVADALSRIRINLLCPLPTRNLWAQVMEGYRNSPLGKLIKEVEERVRDVRLYLENRRGRLEVANRRVKGRGWTGTIEQVDMQVIQVLS
jgi:RNase H-like domain found in reverse transcriptase